MRPAPSQQLSERAIAAWRIDGLRNTVVQGLVVVPLMFFVVRDLGLAVMLGSAELAVASVIFIIIAPRVYARTWRYELSEHEVYIQRGLFTITRHVVPLLRIQNVDTVQGPIDKAFGLSSVTLSTAGGKASIPHLDEPVAGQLRELISARARAARGQRRAG